MLAVARKAAAAREKAKQRLDAAEKAEAIAVQDAYAALGPGYGNVTKIADAIDRSREHVRRVLDRKNGRGPYAATSSDDSSS